MAMKQCTTCQYYLAAPKLRAAGFERDYPDPAARWRIVTELVADLGHEPRDVQDVEETDKFANLRRSVVVSFRNVFRAKHYLVPTTPIAKMRNGAFQSGIHKKPARTVMQAAAAKMCDHGGLGSLN